MGYHGSGASADGGVAEAALEVLRWQWERCDWCTGVVMTHSLGGGTGSGLGSLLLQVPAPTLPLASSAVDPSRPPRRSCATRILATT